MSLMIPPLLQALDAAAKADFQSLRDSYFHLLTACTTAVVIGVMIEEAEYFLSWPSVRRLIPLRVFLPPYRFDSCARIIAKIGWALIVVGVAGEGLYEARASRADGWLQEFSDTLLATAQHQAADAMGEAAIADERAANNEEEAAALRREAARLNKVAEQEHLARVEIEERVAWRRISPRHRDSIRKAFVKLGVQ